MQRKYISRTGLSRFLRSRIDKLLEDKYDDDCHLQPAMHAVHHDLRFCIQVGITDRFQHNKPVSLQICPSYPLLDGGLSVVRCFIRTKKFFISVTPYTVFNDDGEDSHEDLSEYMSEILHVDPYGEGELFYAVLEESELSDKKFISKVHRGLVNVQNIRRCECGQVFSSPDSMECPACMLTATSDISDREEPEICGICLNEMRTDLHTQPCCKTVIHKACFKKAMQYDCKCPTCRC